MGILSNIVGVAPTIEAISKTVDKFIETPDEKRAWEQVKLRIAQEPQLAQIELNKQEASHRTIFVAGWRPALGWIGAFGVGFVFIVNPIIQWITGQPGPELPTGIMFELVLGMLGLGAFRSFEKVKGVAR